MNADGWMISMGERGKSPTAQPVGREDHLTPNRKMLD
jgi:hypothetical protein